MKSIRIAVTTGEPAGIGPEISLMAAQALRGNTVRPILLGDIDMLRERVQQLSLPVSLVAYDSTVIPASDVVEVLHHSLAVACTPGQLDSRNGSYVLALIDRALQGSIKGEFDAIVTAPLQKSTINDAGIAFTGHTEYLAEQSATPRVVMMLAGNREMSQADKSVKMLRVALATTHLALRDVPAAITLQSLLETLTILNTDLKNKFGIANPRIIVTGLNPHAGEGGYLGREEIEIITPALNAAKERGIDVHGPYPADTLFQPKYLDHCDAVLAMYHDQGLPVLKYATFGRGVNITLGLPFIRTSVDHGTALDVAGTGKADAGSMITAIEVAAKMVHSIKKT